MLVVKRLAGVAPEVNLRNPLYTGEEAHKWGISPGFETQGRRHQKSKQGYQWPHKEDMFPPKNFLKKTNFLKPLDISLKWFDFVIIYPSICKVSDLSPRLLRLVVRVHLH